MAEKTKVQQLVEIYEKSYQWYKDTYWTSGEENARFSRGQHWNEEEIQAHYNQKRIPYSIPLIESKVNIILSQQMQTPYDIIAIPRTEEDEISAEIKNAIFKYLTDVNDFKYLISDSYRDGLIKKYAVIKREIDFTDNVEGEILIDKVIYNNFMWDTNCKKYNISRYANWACESVFITRQELADTYPDLAEKIKLIPEKETSEAGEKADQYKMWYMSNNGMNYINVVKFWERRFKKFYKTTYAKGIDQQGQLVTEIRDEDTKPDIPEMNDLERNMMLQQGAEFPVSTMSRTKEYLTLYLFSKDLSEILEEKEIDSRIIPRHCFFANFDDGEIWSFYDLLKDPQKIIDRYFTQIDASIGKLIKNSYQIEWNKLHPDDQADWANIAKDLVSGGGMIRSMGGGDVIKPIDSNSVPPQLFTTMQLIVSVLEDIAGGRNVQGLQENSGESGRAVLARQQQGFLVAYLYIYNLTRFIKGLGEGLNEDINEVYGTSEERIIDITDNSLDELVKMKFQKMGIYKPSEFMRGRGYLKINKQIGDKMLGEAKSRIIIMEGKYEPTEKQRKLQQWYSINEMQIRAGQQPYPVSLWADDLDFAPSVVQKMKDFEAKMEQQKQQAMEAQAKQQQIDSNLRQQEGIRKTGETLNKNHVALTQSEQAVNPAEKTVVSAG